jgi:hypothetical protein
VRHFLTKVNRLILYNPAIATEGGYMEEVTVKIKIINTKRAKLKNYT